MKTSVSTTYPITASEIEKMVTDLEAHQVELEAQNEELRTAKLELEASRDKYHDLFDFAPVGYFTVEGERVVKEVNLTGAAMLQIKKESAVGQPLTKFIDRKDQDVFFQHTQQLSKSNDRLTFELRLVRKDGSLLPVQMNCVPMRCAQGEQHVRISVTDLSERKKIEEKLGERTAELEEKYRELKEFAYVASHDLSEPLRKIQTFGSMLDKKNRNILNEQSLDYLSRMIGAANRMQELLNALLRYSRVETRGQEFTSVKLDEVVRDVETDLHESLRTAGGRLEIGSLSEIKGDPLQLRQLFQNLIGNAIKYHRPESKPLVKVFGERRNNTYRISVADNGIGFDEKYRDLIFQPFQRLHGRNEYPGTGIGLAICKKIAERHGGTITAKSTPGKGSDFIVHLPLADQERRSGMNASPLSLDCSPPACQL